MLFGIDLPDMRDGAETRVLTAQAHGPDILAACSDERIRFYRLFGRERALAYPAIGLGGGRVLEDADLDLVMDRI